MISQEFLGKGELINRLSSQVGSRVKALSILQRRGHLKLDGKTLTEEGLKRNAMSAEERAIDRKSKRLGKPFDAFSYNPITNTAEKLKNF